jgi:hypothetical protein
MLLFSGPRDVRQMKMVSSSSKRKKSKEGKNGETKASDSSKRPEEYAHDWQNPDIPILARGMIKAGDLIFTAGPRDYMKGHSEMGHDHELQEVMEMQDRAWQGEAGGQLCVSSADGGRLLEEYELESPPVLDGMAAAYNRIYLSCMDGSVICFEGEQAAGSE